MARYSGAVCRQCRREGTKLYLKGERCLSKKCALEKRSYPPGEAGQKRAKLKEYGIQLREKQKVKRVYGVLERQFRGYFKKADRTKGITGEQLLGLLESRLDNVVYKLGLASSRPQARQLTRHGHFRVNGARVNIPSYLLRKGDTVEVDEKSAKLAVIMQSMEKISDRQIPEWLSLDRAAMKGLVQDSPVRESIQIPIQEQLIVELYSK